MRALIADMQAQQLLDAAVAETQTFLPWAFLCQTTALQRFRTGDCARRPPQFDQFRTLDANDHRSQTVIRVAKSSQEFDIAGQMKPSSVYARVVDVMEN
ncbi:arsenical resistance protein ArsH [Brucella intermedia]|nr:arsenical resistance protein ArsH [Brucella intermedia]